MEQYKFNTDSTKMIVEAIVDGYKDYIEHRKDRKSNMKISSAFAWTKGNFIESKVADECTKHGFTFKKLKAGLTWDYLQFIHNESKILFLIKNAAYFNENCFSQSKLPTKQKGPLRTYLHELSKINKEISFPTSTFINSKDGTETYEQPTLFVLESQISEELDGFKNFYNEFHILTYAIDDAYQISQIKHYIPNPNDNVAYLVEDLSSFISGAELTEEEREVIAPDSYEDLMDPAAFDIGILDEEQEI